MESPQLAYSATYRRTEVALPALLGVLVLMVIGAILAFRQDDSEAILAAFLWMIGGAVVAILAIFANCFRVHSWTITPDGLEVFERPKVPLAGLRQRAMISYAEIAAVHRIESGLDRVVDIVTGGGRRFRLTQAMKADAGGIPYADPERDLYGFVESIRAAAQADGSAMPEATEGLSFWNSLPGLSMLLIMLALAAAIAVAALLMVLEGEVSTSGGRTGYAAGIAILLPFGAGWLVLKSWRRRRLVLGQGA